MARTLLLARLQRLAGASLASGEPSRPSSDHARLSRRAFLGAGASAGLLATTGCTLLGQPRLGGVLPRVAIVGGGIAGLNCASILLRAGIRPTVHEASARVGGRISSARDAMAPGLVAELGGEFIDSGHREILGLARRLNLPLLDAREDTEAPIGSFFFNGRHHSEAEVIDALRPLAERMASDLAAIGDVRHDNPGADRGLDALSIAEYLDGIGAEGFIRSLLEVACVAEHGLDAGDQSCLNLLFSIGLDTRRGLQLFRDRDERFRVAGGNQQVTDALAAEASGCIERGSRLEALHSAGAGFRLSLNGAAGPRQADADIVVLALPFTLLRQVDLRVDLPPAQRRAINELGMGTSARLLAGVNWRPWRAEGRNGACHSNEAFQSCWDDAAMQPGDAGGLTMQMGGKAGLDVGAGTPEEQLARLLPGVDKAFPGTRVAANGRVMRAHWPTHEFSLGSQSCYRVGQWTTLHGAEGAPAGNLLFAGEQCSVDHPGTMNGAAQTGRIAAEAVLARAR